MSRQKKPDFEPVTQEEWDEAMKKIWEDATAGANGSSFPTGSAGGEIRCTKGDESFKAQQRNYHGRTPA